MRTKKIRRLVAALLFGTLILTSFSAPGIMAEPMVEPQTGETAGQEAFVPSEQDLPDGEYFGYVEPEDVGEPVAVEKDLTIDELDSMVEGSEAVIDEYGNVLQKGTEKDRNSDTATAEPISEEGTELPEAFPSAYGNGSSDELAAIDAVLEQRITPTRNQNPYGSCWAHEAICLTEAYKINQQGAGTSIDNSERHLVYNTFAAGTNPLGFESGDSASLVNVNEKTFLNQGGNLVDAAQALTKWRGVALEEEAPYSSIGSDSWTNVEFLSTGGRLANCYEIAIKENPEMVKRFIREYGAVGVSYYTKSGISPITDSGYYNPATNAYYCNEETDTNHGVSIVGWDDHFPASAFVNNPGSDGAWLIRNNWTSGGTVAQKNYRSYFWMSYQDMSLSDMAFAYKMQDGSRVSENNYFYNDQYHWRGDIYYTGSTKIEAANVFRVSGGTSQETLDSVTFQTFCDNRSEDTSYYIKVYSNLTDPAKPDSGTLVAQKEGELPFLGIYTIFFDNPVVLENGSLFSVVVSVNGGGKTVDFERSATIPFSDGQEAYTASAAAGQSFYRPKGSSSWYDNTSSSYGNYCISVATTSVPEPCSIALYSRTTENAESCADLTLSPEGVDIYPGDEVTVTAPDKTSEGFTFLGWREATAVADGKATAYGEIVLSENLQYTFIADGNLNLVALYEATADVQLRVDPVNGAVFQIDGSAFRDWSISLQTKVGKTHILTAKDADKVLQWENESGKVIGRGESVAITMTGNTRVRLVYKNENNNQAFLQFANAYGQILSGMLVSESDESIDFPTQPTKYGFSFVEWVFSGTDVEATEAAIRSRIASERVIECKPKYQKDSSQFTVSVNYTCEGSEIRDMNTYPEIPSGTGYLVSAPDISGYKFECWKNADGTVLGYYTGYFMMVQGDVSLYACYQPESSTVTAKPVIVLGNLYRSGTEDIHKVSAAATRNIPDGYELIEHGMLYAKDVAGLDETSFVYGTEGVQRYISSDQSKNGVLYGNIKTGSDDMIISFRGYMVVRNSRSGRLETIYSNIGSAAYSALS